MCGKTLPVSKVAYLPVFWATPLSTVIPDFWATPPYYSYKEPVAQKAGITVLRGVAQKAGK